MLGLGLPIPVRDQAELGGSSIPSFVPTNASLFIDAVGNQGWRASTGATSAGAQVGWSRASIAGIYNSNGSMSTVGNNTARLSADDLLWRNSGFLVEQSNTNASGALDFTTAVVGTIGSGGAFPTGVLNTQDSSGLTISVTAKDANGFNVRWQGTANAGLGQLVVGIGPVTAAGIITASFSAQLVAGTWNNVGIGAGNVFFSIEEYSTSNPATFTNRILYAGFQANHGVSQQFLNTDIPWYVEYNSRTVDSGVTFAGPALVFLPAASGAVDFTVRFERPQLEVGTIRTAWQPAASRAADNVTVSGNLTAAPFTVCVQADSPRESATGTLWQLDDGSNNNYVALNLTAYQLVLKIVSGGVTAVNVVVANLPTLTRFTVALSLSGTTYIAAVNGSPVATGAVTPPGSLTTERLGSGANGYWNGFIQTLTHYPTAQASNAAVQTLSLVGSAAYWDDFNRANGLPATAPTGQTYVQQANNGAGTVVASIVSKKLVATDSGFATTAAYTGVDLGVGTVPAMMSTMGTYSAGNNGSGGLLISDPSGVTTITTTSLHSIFTNQVVTWSYFVGSSQSAPESGFPYVTAPTDGTTVQQFAWVINGNAEIYRTLTGEVQRYVDSNFPAVIGRWAIYEHFWNTTNTQFSPMAVSARL